MSADRPHAQAAQQPREVDRAGSSDNGAFTRALLFGIAAAVVGLIGYAAFTITTHLYVGYVALGVGLYRCQGDEAGSGGLGGRPYQIAAVVLTYLAIALAEIPIALWQFHGRIPSGRMFAAGFDCCRLASCRRSSNCAVPSMALSTLSFCMSVSAWPGAALRPNVSRWKVPFG